MDTELHKRIACCCFDELKNPRQPMAYRPVVDDQSKPFVYRYFHSPRLPYSLRDST